MKSYLSFVNRFPRLILAGLLVVTLFFFLQLPSLTMDSNPYLLPEDHPARKTILDMQKEFTGTYDAVLIALYNKEGVFNPITLAATYEFTQSARRLILVNDADAQYLQELGRRYGSEFATLVEGILRGGLEQNDYLQALALRDAGLQLPLTATERSFLEFLPHRINPIKELAGLAATENIVDRNGTLVVHYSLHGRNTPPEVVREEVMANAMMVGGSVSADEKVTLVVVELAIKQEDAEGQLRAYDAFRKIVDDYAAKYPELLAQNEIHIAGVPIFMAEQKKLMDRDLGTLLPVVVAMVTVILVAFFRRPLGVMLPLVNVLMATIWTLGLMAVLHVPMDLITSILPVFLITICGADAIHMMSEYYTQRAIGSTPKEAVSNTLRIMVSPVILTTVTTMVGFLASTSTNISNIQSFGIFMVVGLTSAQIISLLLIPAWIGVFGQWRIQKPATMSTDKAEHAKHEWLGAALERILAPVLRHRRPVAVLFLVALAGLGWQATRINVEDAGSSYFAEGNIFRTADEFVNSHVAGTSPGWISVGTPGERSMLTVDRVTFIDKLDQFLRDQDHVTYTYSLAKYVKRINYVMNGMNPAYDRLPGHAERVTSIDPETGASIQETIAGDDIISQAILMYENGGGSDLTNVLNNSFSSAITLFTMNTTRASEYQAFLSKLNGWLAENQPSDLSVAIGGTPVIWTGVLHEIIKGQLVSILLGLAAVSVVLVLWLRSWRHGVIAALPLGCTLITYYGIMGLAGIDLNIGTAIISFLIVGIVDYSVHYLHRIRHALSLGMGLDCAVLYAIRHSGQSIVFNVLVFSLGFLSLLASDFTPIVNLGTLVAMALSISGFMSIFVISLLAPLFLSNDSVGARTGPGHEVPIIPTVKTSPEISS